MRDYREIECWQSITPQQWNDWQWQVKNQISSLDQLEKVLKVSPKEEDEISKCLQCFKMSITPYYATLIDENNLACPIRMQAVPSIKEFEVGENEIADPLNEEEQSPVEGIVHRYPDRVLFILTGICSMYCRHCTRRRLVGKKEVNLEEEKLVKALDYLRNNKRIRDVVVSGGDPLVLPDAFLEKVISQIRAIPHIEIIRIGTRVPVVLPMRITDDLVKMLSKYHPLWINTHFNHPQELTAASIAACEKLVNGGFPVGSQTVLLKGINDNVETMRELCVKLVKARVRPYYLFHCDLTAGTGHFRTRVETGIEIIKNLRGYISGFAIPTYVIDAPHGKGKVPISPDYISKIDEDKLLLRNYLDETYIYQQIEM